MSNFVPDIGMIQVCLGIFVQCYALFVSLTMAMKISFLLRKCLLLSAVVCLPALAQSQGEEADTLVSASVDAPDMTESEALIALPLPPSSYDLCHYPQTFCYSPFAFHPSPCDFSPFSWRLHQGFNAQLSMNVTSAFGKGAPSGVGFGQSVALAYATPVSKKVTVAAGVHAQNMDWGNYHHTNVGVSAAVTYRPNDNVYVTGYVVKNFGPRRPVRPHQPCSSLYPLHPSTLAFGPSPYTMYPYYFEDYSTRIGASAEFKIGEHSYIHVSFEHRQW
jgi:hypothetical protein